MPLACPECGSRDLRYSRLRSLGERVWSWFGIRPLRCRACHRRFIERTWRLSTVRYARCPRCWRMDLSRWSRNDYRTTFFTDLLLHLGANPYRCAYCRLNFVSFRKRKERYVPRKRKHGSHSGSHAQPKGTQVQP
jgi:DNA-directed RNA polymerase subunit RPC12/RpoP